MKHFKYYTKERIIRGLTWYYHRTVLLNPLRAIPELRGMLRWADGVRYGHNALWHQAAAENLFFGVQYVTESSVDGDVAEFGCFRGRTAKVLSAGMKAMRSAKSLHLFDSFEGLPPSTSKEDLENVHVKSGVWGPGTCWGVSQERLKGICRRFLPEDRIKIYAGWYSQTLSKIPAETKFSLVHVDCDLYLSAFEVLDYLFKFKHLEEGAMLLFDDWDCNRASNNHGERKAWADVYGKYQIQSSDLGGYGWAGHKFIVHSYSAAN